MIQKPVHDPAEHGRTAGTPGGPFEQFRTMIRYDLLEQLTPDPDATADGQDHGPREVFSGHYVPVAPSPIAEPAYISHSSRLFAELGLPEALAHDAHFQRMFSGDLSNMPEPIKAVGWATGYALSIYGTEYTQQCPFQTGNGYGDGRAISVCELEADGNLWELQLKGGGPTPYCRGADGRAVLRSSVREFLAQEYMHALGVPTSRSLSLFVSGSETVMRPWYSEGSRSFNPDIMVHNLVAISTRVAPSFLRVGQLELFARRARQVAHPRAIDELQDIVRHAIRREYAQEVDATQPFAAQVVAFAAAFRHRLIALVCKWMRVGYCQGNFNSDNCAVGGFTLDYGPFGFCGVFDRRYQPWTGGGEHFSFFNQPVAAEANYHMFWSALTPLLDDDSSERAQLDHIRNDFAATMQTALQKMWATKFGLTAYDHTCVQQAFALMEQSAADYTLFFHALSTIPQDITALQGSFGTAPSPELAQQWAEWFAQWRGLIQQQHGDNLAQLVTQLQQINPKYAWREWLIAPAYQQAEQGDYSAIHELQAVLRHPYTEQSEAVHNRYYQQHPQQFANLGGISHYSCSS